MQPATLAKKPFFRAALAVALVLLAACDLLSRTVPVTVHFTSTNGLAAGAAVSLDRARIGKVANLKPDADGVTITLNIDAGQAQRVSADAAALIGSTPPAVEIYNPIRAAKSIAAGATLRGFDSPLALAAWRIDNDVASARQTLGDMNRSINDYLHSEEWRRTRTQWLAQFNQLGQQSDQLVERTTRDLNDLFTELESQSTDAAKQARQQYRELQKQLQEYQRQGQQNLEQALRRILDNLRIALDEKSADPA